MQFFGEEEVHADVKYNEEFDKYSYTLGEVFGCGLLVGLFAFRFWAAVASVFLRGRGYLCLGWTAVACRFLGGS